MATSYAKRAESTDTAGTSYYFLIHSARGLTVVDESFSSWANLAEGVRNFSPEFGADAFKGRVEKGILTAYTDKDVPINLVRLLECKLPDYFWGWVGRPLKGYVRRSTPVPYTSKCRGGSGYFRSVNTMAEARANHGVEVIEEGGRRLVRPSRNASNLPNGYDDIARARKNGWKVQHRGRKSWDHPARHGVAKVFL